KDETPEALKNQLHKVFENYIEIKDALVKDNASKASTDTKDLLENLDRVDIKLIKGEAHNKWMELYEKIKANTTSISKTAGIKDQRNYFKQLSDSFIQAVQLFGVNEKVYVEYCPMVNNDEGAYWLSKEEQIFNPYFGNAMLTCGEVK